MKATSEYITLLRKYMAENASKYGIMRMGIFGSVARDEQTVEFTSKKSFNTCLAARWIS